jgi:hypothetical protein
MPKLEGAWQGVVWGTPALLASTLAASLLGLDGAALVAVFWCGLAAFVTMAGLAGPAQARLAGKALVAAALLLAMIFYVLRYDVAVLSDAGWTISLTLVALLGAVIASAVRQRTSSASKSAAAEQDEPLPVPAE